MTVFPTSYFPSVAYLKAICRAESPVIDLGEHYVKQTQRNRYSVLSANGPLDLSIPVIRPNGNKTLTGLIEVSEDLGWRRDHWRSITAAYSSSPYFEHYESEIQALVFQKTKLLSDFNFSALRFLQSTLQLEFEYISSPDYMEHPEIDFRYFNFPSDSQTYQQVMFGQEAFVSNLSVLDALFCLGPMARNLITTENNPFKIN